MRICVSLALTFENVSLVCHARSVSTKEACPYGHTHTTHTHTHTVSTKEEAFRYVHTHTHTLSHTVSTKEEAFRYVHTYTHTYFLSHIHSFHERGCLSVCAHVNTHTHTHTHTQFPRKRKPVAMCTRIARSPAAFLTTRRCPTACWGAPRPWLLRCSLSGSSPSASGWAWQPTSSCVPASLQ